LRGDLRSFVLVDTLEQHRELVAPESRDRVAASRRVQQDGRHALQHAVARCVALGVVDGLEVIQVDEQHADSLGIAGAVCQRMVDAIAKERAVGKSRQGIVERLVKQLGLERLALRDVLHDGNEPEVRAPPRVRQHERSPRQLAVRLDETCLTSDAAPFAGDGFHHQRVDRLRVLRGGEFGERASRQFGQGASEEVLEGFIRIDDPRVPIQPGDAECRVLENGPQPQGLVARRRVRARGAS
jgi:hypothetical protein